MCKIEKLGRHLCHHRDDEIDQSHKAHSLSIPDEFVPKIRPKKAPNIRFASMIKNHKPIKPHIKLCKRNMHIKEEDDKLKVSFSFDEEYNNYETKETETNINEESLLSLRKSLSFFKNVFISDRISKDDNVLDIRSKSLIEYSSIIKSAIAINRRFLSSDLSSFINQ